MCYQVLSGKDPYCDFETMFSAYSFIQRYLIIAEITAFVVAGNRLSLDNVPQADLISRCWAHNPKDRPGTYIFLGNNMR